VTVRIPSMKTKAESERRGRGSKKRTSVNTTGEGYPNDGPGTPKTREKPPKSSTPTYLQKARWPRAAKDKARDDRENIVLAVAITAGLTNAGS
jgi:hypothetical protein